VTKCPDGSFCCGSDNLACCDQGHGIRIESVIGLSATTSVSVSTTTLLTVLTLTPTAGSGICSDPGLSSGAQAGVGVGVALTVLLIIAGLYVWCRRSRDSFPPTSVWANLRDLNISLHSITQLINLGDGSSRTQDPNTTIGVETGYAANY
jgi:hypothetical protein